MNKSRFLILGFPLPVALLCSSCRDVAKLNILRGQCCFRSFYCGVNYKRRTMGRADWSCPGVVLLSCSSLPNATVSGGVSDSLGTARGQGHPGVAGVQSYEEVQVMGVICGYWARGLVSFHSTATKPQLQG